MIIFPMSRISIQLPLPPVIGRICPLDDPNTEPPDDPLEPEEPPDDPPLEVVDDGGVGV